MMSGGRGVAVARQRPINLRQIDAFRAVMTTGSATQAAVLMGVTQPAISRLISELERQIELRLFERHKGRLRSTPEAEALFGEIARAYTGLERIASFLEDIRQVRTGHFRLTASAPLGHSLVPTVVKRFREAHPDVSISIKIMVRREAQGWLDSQEFDLALSTLPVEYPAPSCELLAEVDAVCVMPKDHPLAARDVVAPRDLQDFPYISFVPEALARFKTDLAFNKAGVRRDMALETQTAISVCDLVTAGAGVSVVDPFTAFAFRDRLVIRRFRPAIGYGFAMLFPVRRPRSLIADRFSEFVRKGAAEYVAAIDALTASHKRRA